MGPDSIELFDGFTFAADADKGNSATVIEKFENYGVCETNETYERYKCNTRVQEIVKSILIFPHFKQ